MSAPEPLCTTIDRAPVIGVAGAGRVVTDLPSTTLLNTAFGTGSSLSHVPGWMCAGWLAPDGSPVKVTVTTSLPSEFLAIVAVPLSPELPTACMGKLSCRALAMASNESPATKTKADAIVRCFMIAPFSKRVGLPFREGSARSPRVLSWTIDASSGLGREEPIRLPQRRHELCREGHRLVRKRRLQGGGAVGQRLGSDICADPFDLMYRGARPEPVAPPQRSLDLTQEVLDGVHCQLQDLADRFSVVAEDLDEARSVKHPRRPSGSVTGLIHVGSAD